MGPGVIYVGNTAYKSDTDIWSAVGSSVTLLAFPNPGYVFAGWQPGPHQVIQGFQDTVTLTVPVSVFPLFQVARRINLATVPAELEVLADRAPVPTPTTMEWGWGSTHTVGILSPEQDDTGGRAQCAGHADRDLCPGRNDYVVQLARGHEFHGGWEKQLAQQQFHLGRRGDPQLAGARAANRFAGPDLGVRQLVERRVRGADPHGACQRGGHGHAAGGHV
jgi:hypothetical protein